LRDQYTDEDDPQPPDFARAVSRELPPNFDPDELLGIVHAYAGQVSLLDACLGLWHESWQATPAAAYTLLSVMGWRGFALGEHGQIGMDENQLTGEMVQVPWMLRLPDGRGALARSSALFTQSDLAPTLLDWFAAQTQPGSVLPIIAGDASELRQAVYLRSAGELAIRTLAWHLRLRGAGDSARTMLYAKPSDRWEVNEVSDRCKDIAESLRNALLARERGGDMPASLTPELTTQVD
jgi:arylsulfatase A-like enzyme